MKTKLQIENLIKDLKVKNNNSSVQVRIEQKLIEERNHEIRLLEKIVESME